VEDVVKASGCENALGPPEQGLLVRRLDASACGLGHRAEPSLELTCQDRGLTPLHALLHTLLHALGAPFLPESLGKGAHRIGLIAVLTLIALPLIVIEPGVVAIDAVRASPHPTVLLFSHSQMVADLIRGFVHEDWVADLDFATLERVSEKSASADLRTREDDMIWRLRWGERWLYVYLLLEFQSRVERLMAVRLLTCRTCEPC